MTITVGARTRATVIIGASALLMITATTPASAAPVALAPVWASSTHAPGAAYTGFHTVLAPEGTFGELLPLEPTTTQLEAGVPPIGSGWTVAPALLGTVELRSELTAPGPEAASRFYAGTAEPLNGDYTPANDEIYGSTWFWNRWNGQWTYELDFSGLEGGVLPAGSRLFTGDLDMTRGDGELAQLTSSATGEWLTYDYDQISAGYPEPALRSIVSFDADVSEYSVRGPGPNVDLANWFTLTQDVTSVSVTLTHGVNPNRGAIVFGLQIPLIPVEKGITLDKRVTGVTDVNGNGVTDEGDEIGWAFDVTNTGNVPLAGVRVQDDLLAALGVAVTCPPIDLAAGATVTCEADGTYPVTAADVLAGAVVNTATAHGDPGDGEITSQPDTTRTPVQPAPTPTPTDPPTTVPPTEPPTTTEPPAVVTPPLATATPSSSAPNAPSSTPVATTTPAGSLPSTGSSVPTWLPLAGVTAVGGGLLLVLVARRRTHRG